MDGKEIIYNSDLILKAQWYQLFKKSEGKKEWAYKTSGVRVFKTDEAY